MNSYRPQIAPTAVTLKITLGRSRPYIRNVRSLLAVPRSRFFCVYYPEEYALLLVWQ